MLPPVNLSILDHERKQLKLDKLNDMFEKKLNAKNMRQTGDKQYRTSLELAESSNAHSSQQPWHGQRTHRKYTTKTTPYVLVTQSWTTPKGLNVSRVLSSTLSWTSSFSEATTADDGNLASFVPSKSNSKPFMQTYKINEKKRLPNQFASLRLNYGTVSGKSAVDEVLEKIR